MSEVSRLIEPPEFKEEPEHEVSMVLPPHIDSVWAKVAGVLTPCGWPVLQDNNSYGWCSMGRVRLLGLVRRSLWTTRQGGYWRYSFWLERISING